MDGEPKNKREARRWIREYWASLIRSADMGGVADMENDYLDEVWGTECERIHDTLMKRSGKATRP